MNATVFFQALTQAILISLVQAIIIYVLTQLILSASKNFTSSFRYSILYTSLFLICVGFLINLYSNYSLGNDILIKAGPGILNQIPATQTIIPYSFWIAGVYLAGLSFQTIRLVMGVYKLEKKSLKDSTPVPLFWSQRMEELKLKLGIIRKISFHFSENALVPFTAGFVKPVVLFPFALINQLSTEQVEAILIHELAHIKRNDYLMNIFQRVMEIILFFNPVIWLLAKQIKVERELCCDALVLQHSSNMVNYARALALIEEHRFTINNLAMAATGNRNNGLLTRIKKITDMKTEKSNPRLHLMALLGVIVIGLSLAWIVPDDTLKAKNDTNKFQKPGKLPANVPAPPAPPANNSAHPVPAPPVPADPALALPPAPPTPPAPADTTELKKYFNSPEWKAQEKAIKKSAEEMSKYFDSPEWKSKISAIEKSGDELEKKFNSPEWKNKIKELENLGEELDKKFNGPEWEAHTKRLADHSAELEKKFNSPEWKDKMKKLEDNSKELEKKFSSAEWKAKMKKLEDRSKELEKKFNSAEWKEKMKDLESKKEKSNTDTLK